MAKLCLLPILLFSVVNLAAQTIQDNKRLLYLFGSQQQAINQQLHFLSLDGAGCEERDIKIIIADTVKTPDTLYKRYQAKTDQFMVVLVGKDGGEKFRSREPVKSAQLFAVIDQMPMRKQEIKLKPNQ